VLYRLVSRSVFSITHRIVREHEDGGKFHQGREPDRRPFVIAEDEEGRAVGPELRDGHPIQGRPHGVFPDAEVQVFACAIIRLKMSGAFVGEQRLVRWSEIGRSAQKPRDILREDVQRLGGRLAPGDTLLVRRKDGQIAIPSGRKFTPLDLFDFRSQLGILGAVCFEKLRPFAPRAPASLSDPSWKCSYASGGARNFASSGHP
jgi:hypothetical protein